MEANIISSFCCSKDDNIVFAFNMNKLKTHLKKIIPYSIKRSILSKSRFSPKNN